MSSALVCPNCSSQHIEQHDASGASVCTECGVVVEENAIVSSVEFVEGTGGASSMVGQFVSATSSKAYTSGGGGRGGGRFGYGFSRDSRETTLANGRRRIQEVASRLRLGVHYVDAAHRLFTIAVEKNFVQGRRTTHVVAACLYISCRQEKTQHMLIDFSDALQVNVYTLGACFLKFRRLLGLKLEILDPALYVYRFAAHLDLDDKANAVALTALRLVGRMKRDWIVAGRRPAGICAAALLISARAHGFSRHPQDVTRILRVCGLTVTTRVKEFEQTPTAKFLTLDQFHNVELQAESDPPIYTKNKIMEARARAIQENNIELLTSGALDDPMSSATSASKWRNGKISEKMVRFEQLYKSLEKEMMFRAEQQNEGCEENEAIEDEQEEEESEENHVGKKGDEEDEDHELSGEQPKASVSDDSGMEKQHQSARTGEKSLEFAAPACDTDADQKSPNKVAVDKLKVGASQDADDNAGLLTEKDNKEVEISSTNDVVTPENTKLSNETRLATENQLAITSQWAKAYPKRKGGKAIVLPDHATAEERLPSLVPVEAKLDLKEWKQEMPPGMIDDIESIFRNPAEVAQKEAIFNKINKDYIEVQARKERNRLSAEQEQNDDDKELAEQTQGHERYRKRKNRKSTGAETTEEALLQVVANRKISRKINYDAMSSIFDQDGTFSTDGGSLLEADAPVTEF